MNPTPTIITMTLLIMSISGIVGFINCSFSNLASYGKRGLRS